MSQTPPALGSRISITFTGIVTESSEDTLKLDDRFHIEISEADVVFPEHTVLAPGPKSGDLGVYTNYRGERELMMFRRDNHSGEIGWFGHDDVRPTTPNLVTPIDPANVTTLINAVAAPSTN